MDLRTIHLCAGSGGGILGGMLVGHLPVCAVEIDPYCQRVLIQRQQDGLLPSFPIWDDVRTFDGHAWRGHVECIHAGFPCQPFSTAGKQHGAQDTRNLWPDINRIIGAVRPRYVFLENVPDLVTFPYFGVILGQLTAHGYDSVWAIIGADDVGANHRRKRLWLLADADTGRCHTSWPEPGVAPCDWTADRSQRCGEDVADARSAGRRRGSLAAELWEEVTPGSHTTDVAHHDSRHRPPSWPDQGQAWPTNLPVPRSPGDELGPRWWAVEPDVGRVAHGVPTRLDRLRALGNAQVPLCVAAAWHLLTAHLKES